MKKQKIEDVMDKIGVPECAKGYEYILEALMMMDDPKWENTKWMKVYEEIGKRFGKTGKQVERSIRYCFDVARKNSGEEYDIKYYLGSICGGNHRTLKHFYKILKREEEDENSNA